MKLKKFNYKTVNSTNDLAIKIIKTSNNNSLMVYICDYQKNEEEGTEENGFPIKEIYLLQYFLT